MTAIVGIEHRGRVWIGGDRAGSDGETIHRLTHSKAWLSGGIVIGGAGALACLQRLRFDVGIPRYRGGSSERYLAKALAPAFRTATDMGPWADLSLLVGVGGRLWAIDDGGAFVHVGPEWAIGSGGDTARGALGLLPRTKLKPEFRIAEALRAAATAHPLSVCGPFDVVHI